MRLSELFNKHGTDKENYHRYGTGCYDTLFLPFKYSTFYLLEIGVYYGNSLRAWHEFFPHAGIEGVDIDPKETEIAGCDIMKADAYSDDFIGTLQRYDIIIDDGPHGLKNQQIFLEKYWCKLRPGGLLVIEDIETHADLAALNAVRPFDFSTHTINLGGAPNSQIAVWVAR